MVYEHCDKQSRAPKGRYARVHSVRGCSKSGAQNEFGFSSTSRRLGSTSAARVEGPLQAIGHGPRRVSAARGPSRRPMQDKPPLNAAEAPPPLPRKEHTILQLSHHQKSRPTRSRTARPRASARRSATAAGAALRASARASARAQQEQQAPREASARSPLF